jgi:nucleoside-diphosphate-sugar epimerase
VAVLRLSNLYGPGDRDRVIPIWLERARRGQALELYGGEQVIDFVPVHVVVHALQRAAVVPLRQQAVNVASGTGISLHELAARVKELPGARVNLHISPARSVEVTRFIADVGRMETLLSIQPPADPLSELQVVWESRQDP